uniref:CRIB domain-containing protein n=1 Tax=Hucho hucho TaxID=62062 RepID=A0A4W5PDA8_9TELE
MTEFWVCFSCCVGEQPQPKRRRRIDRSMIGEPTNFVHTTHVGSGDMGVGLSSVRTDHPPSHREQSLMSYLLGKESKQLQTVIQVFCS